MFKFSVAQTDLLTKGLDNVPGTSGNDTIIGSIVATATSDLNTLSTLDVVNGGAGVDTLKVATDGTDVGLPNMTNVEIVEVESAGAATVDTSAVTGVTNLNVLKAATAVSAKAAATTDINVSLKQGAAVVNGTDGTAPDTKADIAVTGGKNVTVNVTDVKQVLGNDVAAPNNELNAIVVGGAGAAAATGDVVVSSTGVKAAAGGSKLSSIKVEGGKTISVTQKATSDASAAVTDTAGITVTQGNVTVVANAATTDVTVKQDVAVGAVAGKVAVAGTAAQTSVKFTAVAKDVVVTVGGLSFKAAKDLSAAEVAQAFANITKGINQLASGQETQVAGVLANGTYSGSFTVTGWTSGAAAGDTVTFTGPKTTGVTFPTPMLSASAKTATGATTNAAVTPTPVVSGLTEVKAVTGVLGVAAGKVDITAGAATKTITIDSYGGSSAITTASALETLNLSNAAGTTFAGTPLAATAIAGVSVTGLNATGTLALNLEKVGTKTVAGAVNLGAGTQVLNVKSTGDNNVTLTSTGTKTLSVDGTGLLTAKTAGLAGTETITVKGAAGLDLTGATLTALKSVDTTATTGAVTVAISEDATYAGGAGNDTVTISGTPAATALTKTVDLGAGNNKLDLTGVTGLFGATSTAKFVAGAGTQDTLVLGAAQANSTAGLSSTVDFQKTFSGFERLEVAASTGANTINLDNLNDINYVISKGDSAAKTAQKAVITLNLTGASLAADGDKITFDGTDLAVAASGATGILALIGATIAVGGVTYDIDKSAGLAAIKLTARTAANLDATAAAALTLGATGGGVAPTATAPTLNTAGVAEVAATAALVLDKMLTGATVQLDGVSLSTEVKLAADGAGDVVNVIANATNGTNLGIFKAALVETLNITAGKTYEVTDANGVKTTKGAENVLALDATAAKTITVTGAGALDLGTLTTAKLGALTSVDGATNTGGLKVDLGVGLTNAVTLTGGAGNDVLKASVSLAGTTTAKKDVLVGGAGDDTLYAGSNGAKLTGGEGKDLFVLNTANDSATSFSSIEDFSAGDVLQLQLGGVTGSLKALSISAAGDILNFVNAAIKEATAATDAVYFVYGSDSYVVVDRGTSTDTFTNGEDAIIKLTGVNLDTQAFSFNSTQGTIELV